MARLERLEADVGELKNVAIRLAELAVDQSERMDLGFRSVREEFRSEFRAVREEMAAMHEGLATRLDRLIEVTIKERTYGADRFGELERRLARVEQHVGIPRT